MPNAKTLVPKTATPNIKLSAEEFKRIAALVYDLTGIHLPEQKLTLLSNRLRKRVRALGLDGFEAYYKLLCDRARCASELPEFLSAVTTNETYFFRNERLWERFRQTWLPDLVKAKGKARSQSIRIWSAACSSGEEAYTAAMCLAEDLPNVKGWCVEIVGTDISRNMLDRAATGTFGDYAVARMPGASRDKWFKHQEQEYVLDPKLRNMVRFQFHNLRDPFTNGRFDVVFLRNVLMYFDTAMKQRVIKVVSDAMAPGALMIVGDVDPIWTTPKLSAVMTCEYQRPGLYRKPGGGSANLKVERSVTV